MIPEHTKERIDRYVNHGFNPGDFLYAVLCNDLKQSFARADLNNRIHMFDIVSYIYNKIPYICQGSIERVRNWMACFDEKGVMIHEPKG